LALSAASLLAGACGGTPNDGTGSGGQTASGGTPGTGGSSTGGTNNTGGGPSSGGTSSGGSSSGGTGGTAAGGSSSGGSNTGGTASGGAGTGGGGGTDECTRELLDGTLDDYFDALSAHDASTLSLSSTVKFTENAEESEIGEAGLWLTAGEVEYSQRMLDVDDCTAAAHAVLTADGDDYILAIRIKLEGQEITEVETIAVPPGSYTGGITANPGAIVAIADEVGWPEVVPEAERATHEEMVAWLEKYFSFFPQGVCNVASSCTRLENGGGNFNCGTGATCTAGDPGPSDNNLPSREIHADVETGVGIGMTIYSDNIDMHMYKMVDGQVLAVQAVFYPTNGDTGWD
jgi:hypothetical protein